MGSPTGFEPSWAGRPRFFVRPPLRPRFLSPGSVGRTRQNYVVVFVLPFQRKFLCQIFVFWQKVLSKPNKAEKGDKTFHGSKLDTLDKMETMAVKLVFLAAWWPKKVSGKCVDFFSEKELRIMLQFKVQTQKENVSFYVKKILWNQYFHWSIKIKSWIYDFVSFWAKLNGFSCALNS